MGAGGADEDAAAERAEYVLRRPQHPPPLPPDCLHSLFLFQCNKQTTANWISANVFSSPLRSW